MHKTARWVNRKIDDYPDEACWLAFYVAQVKKCTECPFEKPMCYLKGFITIQKLIRRACERKAD